MNESQRIRFSEALQRVAGDEEMLIMLAEIASEDGPEMLARLDEQVKAESCVEAAKTAHALKGLLSGFEAGEPTSHLQRLIEACRGGRRAEAKAIWNDISPAIESLLEEIAALGQVNAT
ncbi:hypothetical protein FYK55_14005 [Roseiconus nitratireducens]|uniref:Hpt domain-containing protein n=1 Tax=Roseiconus nitratireducens TaxID=2605748 RepID=A0A5M6D5L7_9BACT|nr:hypothetical protein [Roseiconus nitratireducens]KAA5542643.1 hypothetical protein FYK55_14005 [Roseiconus nitratireducens]